MPLPLSQKGLSERLYRRKWHLTCSRRCTAATELKPKSVAEDSERSLVGQQSTMGEKLLSRSAANFTKGHTNLNWHENRNHTPLRYLRVPYATLRDAAPGMPSAYFVYQVLAGSTETHLDVVAIRALCSTLTENQD